MSRKDGRPRSLPAYDPENDPTPAAQTVDLMGNLAESIRAKREERHAGVRLKMATDAAAASLDAIGLGPGDTLTYAQTFVLAEDAAARALDAYRGKR